jgi:hypothetical protein
LTVPFSATPIFEVPPILSDTVPPYYYPINTTLRSPLYPTYVLPPFSNTQVILPVPSYTPYWTNLFLVGVKGP